MLRTFVEPERGIDYGQREDDVLAGVGGAMPFQDAFARDAVPPSRA